jgi:ankyrin repeat protein
MSIIGAVYGKKIGRVRRLLSNPGIDVNEGCSPFGWTPLTIASASGYTAIVKLLLTDPGIDVNQPNNGGYTALMTASREGHTAIVKLLLAVEGIDVNKANQDGDTALLFASLRGHTSVVQLLLAARGIDVNKGNNYGKTALMYASQFERTATVKLLNTYLARANARKNLVLLAAAAKFKIVLIRARLRAWAPGGAAYLALQQKTLVGKTIQ